MWKIRMWARETGKRIEIREPVIWGEELYIWKAAVRKSFASISNSRQIWESKIRADITEGTNKKLW